MAPVRLVREAELAEGQRVLKDVFGRTVTVLRHRGTVYCIDAACSHMGGPLGIEGDIEDFDGRSCIRCPWHGRKFDLESGCELERDLTGCLAASEPRQRVHQVYFAGDGWIWVDLRSSPAMASDVYNEGDTVSPPAKQQRRQSYGLGFDSFDGMGMSQDSNRSSFGSIGWPLSQETISSSPQRPASPAEPLAPYAGVDRMALPPSPSRARPAQLQPPPPPLAPQPHAHQAAPQISFPGRKPTAASLRRQRAADAVRKSTFVPPSVPAPAPATSKRVRQATLTDLFGRQQQQHAAMTAAAATESIGMDLS